MADATGMSHAVMEHQLARHRIRGTPRLRVPQYMVLPLVIAWSDPLVVMLSRLAETFASLMPLKVMTPPVPLPVFDIAVYCHERFNSDPGNRWFRRLRPAVPADVRTPALKRDFLFKSNPQCRFDYPP